VHWLLDEVWLRPGVAVFIIYLFVYWAYQIFIAVRGVWSPSPLSPAKSFRRFAILIPAHNEEKVIGNLLESLMKQNYPKNYFDIYVSCDNCQDRTVEVAKSYSVNVLEKHDIPGGRARKLSEQGFTFDMGPSWYWMPDVFERYFNCLAKKYQIIINWKDWILPTGFIGRITIQIFLQITKASKNYLKALKKEAQQNWILF